MAVAELRRSLAAVAPCALAVWLRRVGIAIEDKIPMMAEIVSTSTRVKPLSSRRSRRKKSMQRWSVISDEPDMANRRHSAVAGASHAGSANGATLVQPRRAAPFGTALRGCFVVRTDS